MNDKEKSIFIYIPQEVLSEIPNTKSFVLGIPQSHCFVQTSIGPQEGHVAQIQYP